MTAWMFGALNSIGPIMMIGCSATDLSRWHKNEAPSTGTQQNRGQADDSKPLHAAAHNDERRTDMFVNGTKFTYPSVGGANWTEVSPSMSGHSFRLPKSDRYEVRFEIRNL